jgi:tryptophan-rich sensory protein
MKKPSINPQPQSFFFVWVLVALIYAGLGVYIQFFSNNKDAGEAIFNYSMAVVWLSIGYSFKYTPPPKK